jgi:hypothetical protein
MQSAALGPRGVASGIVAQQAGNGAQRGGGRSEEGQPGAQRFVLLLRQGVPGPERLPPVSAAIRQDCLPFGTQVMLEFGCV